MAYLVELEFAAKTDTGMVRPHNEDSIALSEGNGLAILADGMGGYNAGEVASNIATVVLKYSVEDGLQGAGWDTRPAFRGKYVQTLLVDSVGDANTAIIESARSEPQYSGMGTTVVMALFHHDKVTVAHVGDSRAYRLRQGEFVQVTRDHSLLQEQIDAGLITPEWAQFSQNKNFITRAVGIDHELEVEVHEHHTEVGDIYLLCSDGMSDMVTDQQMCDVLLGAASSLDAACATLVQKANSNGGHDNISVILIKVKAIGGEAEGLVGRILNWIK
jgi:PPM family protein phosphatase